MQNDISLRYEKGHYEIQVEAIKEINVKLARLGGK